MKRAELMSKVNTTTRTSLLNLEPTNGTLSKSSLRRQKRKQKEQLAGNTTGMKDLADAMDEVAQQVEEEDDEHEGNAPDIDDDDEGMNDDLSSAQRRTSSAYPTVGAQRTRKDATVTEKARKKAL